MCDLTVALARVVIRRQFLYINICRFSAKFMYIMTIQTTLGRGSQKLKSNGKTKIEFDDLTR